MPSALTIRTFCHEKGHMLCSSPDLYDNTPSVRPDSEGVGDYCLMGSGGHCANDSANLNPTQVCAYLKNKAGWADIVIPLEEGWHDVDSEINEFYICNNRDKPAEYFIIEYRRQIGRDQYLPARGLVIWHVDELGSNNDADMKPTKHYECSLEQADGRFDLEHGSNCGNAEDLFRSPGSTNFHGFTLPNSRWWDDAFSKLVLIDIHSTAGHRMRFNFALSLRYAAQMTDPTLSEISVRQLASRMNLSPPISLRELIRLEYIE